MQVLPWQAKDKKSTGGYLRGLSNQNKGGSCKST